MISTTTQNITCPSCGSVNSYNAEKCALCGLDLGVIREAMIEARKQQKEAEIGTHDQTTATETPEAATAHSSPTTVTIGPWGEPLTPAAHQKERTIAPPPEPVPEPEPRLKWPKRKWGCIGLVPLVPIFFLDWTVGISPTTFMTIRLVLLCVSCLILFQEREPIATCDSRASRIEFEWWGIIEGDRIEIRGKRAGSCDLTSCIT